MYAPSNLSNLREKRLERSLPKDHEDRIAGKGFNSLSHHNLAHKFMPIHQAMQIPGAKAAVDKECEKLETLPAWQMTKVKSKSRSHSGSTNIAKNSPFYLEEWLRVGEDSTGDLEKILLRQFLRLISQRWYVVQKTQVAPSNTHNLWKHSQHRDQWRSLMRQPGSYLDPRVLHPSGRKRRHHCLNFIHPKQLSPFLERLELPFPIEEILSGTEDVVSSGTDRYTTWVKTDPDCYFSTTYGRHSKGRRRVPSARRHDTFSQGFHFDNAPDRSLVQKRLSIYNWNSGHLRGKEGAFEKQIAGKWHVVTLQEAIDDVDHELLTNRFHVTHHGGCAVLSNKDTFYIDVEVKSINLHDTRRELPDKVMEGDPGWDLQGVISRASFRRRLLSIRNIYAKNGRV